MPPGSVSPFPPRGQVEKEPVSPLELEEPHESVFQRSDSESRDEDDVSPLVSERAKAIAVVAAGVAASAAAGRGLAEVIEEGVEEAGL